MEIDRRKIAVQYIGLAGLLILYTALALAHTRLAPLTTGPDELAHYEYVNFIAEHGRLPLDETERGRAGYKSDQPPLYHLLAAMPASLVDPAGPPTLKRFGDHPRRQLIERTRHAWGLYNSEDELWPYRAEVLRWQVGRWVSVFFGLATVAAIFWLARSFFGPDSWLLALGAAGLVAFIPRFILTGSMLNYETALALAATLYVGLLLRLAAPNPPARYIFLLGLWAGLAIAVKLSGLILPLEIALALGLAAWYHGRQWGRLLRHILTAAAGTLLGCGWWFGFILYRFNTVAEDGLWVGLLRPLIAADASDATTNRLLSLLTGGEAGFTAPIENLDSGPVWEWLLTLFRTFWVVGIEGHRPLGWTGLLLALALCIGAGVGLWRIFSAHALRSRKGLLLSLLLLHLIMPFVLPFLRYLSTFSLADTAQGRHILFLAAPAFALLVMWGWSGVTIRPAAWLLPALFMLAWSGVQLWYMSWAYHPLLPVRTVPAARAQAVHRLDRPINEAIRLVGYDRRFEADMLRLDLIWEATAVSPVDYLTEVTLRDGADRTRSQWLGYPAGGRYPTRAWDVGDIVRDTVWLPLGGLEPGQYSLSLDLLPTSRNRPESPLATPLPLTDLTVDDPPAPVVTLWPEDDRFQYRQTVLVTLDPDQPQQVRIVGPGERLFEPVRQLPTAALFIVGPDWPTGDYRVEVGPTSTDPPLTFQVIDRWERRFEEPPIAHRLEANFANRIKLLGYELGANRAEPGGGLPVILYWQALDWLGTDYTIFTKLMAVDQTVHGGRDRLPLEGYRTLYWAPGEIIVDPFGVPVDPDAPPGVYYLNVGLYHQVGGQAVSLPLMQEGQPVEATSVNIGPIKVGGPPPGATVETAAPQIPLDRSFGEPPALTLLGYDMVAGERSLACPVLFQAGELAELTLRLYWRSEAILPVDYTLFVHLQDAAGEIAAQRDRPPAYPTALWDPGEIIPVEIRLPLPPELSPGPYRLVIGWYDFDTGLRLPAPDQPENSLPVCDIEVVD